MYIQTISGFDACETKTNAVLNLEDIKELVEELGYYEVAANGGLVIADKYRKLLKAMQGVTK